MGIRITLMSWSEKYST